MSSNDRKPTDKIAVEPAKELPDQPRIYVLDAETGRLELEGNDVSFSYTGSASANSSMAVLQAVKSQGLGAIPDYEDASLRLAEMSDKDLLHLKAHLANPEAEVSGFGTAVHKTTLVVLVDSAIAEREAAKDRANEKVSRTIERLWGAGLVILGAAVAWLFSYLS